MGGTLDRFIEIYDVVTGSTSSFSEFITSKLIHNIGVKEGITNVGFQIGNEVLICYHLENISVRIKTSSKLL